MKKNTLTAETVKTLKKATSNLYEKDQVNNFKGGDTALSLSASNLDDLNGISTLQVKFNGKTVPNYVD